MNTFYRAYNRLFTSLRKFGNLNFEAKLGIFLLIPPIISVFLLFSMPEIRMDYYIWWGGDSSAIESNLPIYMGLMAIAGAYLIKGNTKKQQ